MPRSRVKESQIITILKEHEAGLKAAELCRIYGMSEATFYNWKAKYSVAERFDTEHLKALETENVKLRMLLSDVMLENATIKEQLAKK